MKKYLVCLLVLMLSIVMVASDKKVEKKKQLIPGYQAEADKILIKFKSMKLPKGTAKIMHDAASALKKEYPALGLKVGEKAPAFKLKDENGKEVSLEESLEKGPVVLNFYRGGWCTFCKIELQVLEKSLPLFKKYNAQLIAITPQIALKSKEQKMKSPFSFPVLSDTDYKVITAYKLMNEMPQDLIKLYKDSFKLDVESYNGKGRTALPAPGLVVINQKGFIVASFADTDYKKRMEPKAIIKALKSLSK